MGVLGGLWMPGLSHVLRAIFLVLLLTVGACLGDLSEEVLGTHKKNWDEARISDYSYDNEA